MIPVATINLQHERRQSWHLFRKLKKNQENENPQTPIDRRTASWAPQPHGQLPISWKKQCKKAGTLNQITPFGLPCITPSVTPNATEHQPSAITGVRLDGQTGNYWRVDRKSPTCPHRCFNVSSVDLSSICPCGATIKQDQFHDKNRYTPVHHRSMCCTTQFGHPLIDTTRRIHFRSHPNRFFF